MSKNWIKSMVLGAASVGVAVIASSAGTAKADCTSAGGHDWVISGRIQVNDPSLGGVKNAEGVEVTVQANRALESAPVWGSMGTVAADATGNFTLRKHFGSLDWPCSARQIRVQVRFKSPNVNVERYLGDSTLDAFQDARKSESTTRNIGTRVFNQTTGAELRDAHAVRMARAYVQAMALEKKMLADSNMDPVTISYRTGATATTADVASKTVILDDAHADIASLYKAMWDIWFQKASITKTSGNSCPSSILAGLTPGHQNADDAFRKGFVEFADGLARYEMGLLTTKPTFDGCGAMRSHGITSLAAVERYSYGVREALELLVDHHTFADADFQLIDVLYAFTADSNREGTRSDDFWVRDRCVDGLYKFIDRVSDDINYDIVSADITAYKAMFDPTCPGEEEEPGPVVVVTDAGVRVDAGAGRSDAGTPVVEEDAGAPVVEEDAGTPVVEEDAGVGPGEFPEADAGEEFEADAGTVTVTPAKKPRGSSAGCSAVGHSSDGSIVGLGLLLGLAVVSRRRKRA